MHPQLLDPAELPKLPQSTIHNPQNFTPHTNTIEPTSQRNSKRPYEQLQDDLTGADYISEQPTLLQHVVI